jgi:5S rRNA maturation endonuclease (ribonuclease M5)
MVRFYLGWPYPIIIDVFGERIDNLNGYNLSNHFNYHVDREMMKFWRNLRDSIGIYKLSSEESEAFFQQIKKSFALNQIKSA